MNKLYEKFLNKNSIHEQSYSNAYDAIRKIIKEIEKRGAEVNEIETTFDMNYMDDDEYLYVAEVYIYDCDDEEEVEKYIDGIYNKFTNDFYFDTYDDGSCVVKFDIGIGDEYDMYDEYKI